MTLTIERLKWLHDAATELSATKLKMTMRPDELLVLTSELLANREAQPVGYIDPDSLKEYRGQRAGGTWSAVQRTTSGLNMTTPIYTAPPAPAVPDGYCVMPLTLTAENGAKGALSGEFKVSRTVRCHECGGEGCDDCGDAGEFEEEITIPWETIKDIYRAAVTTCSTVLQAAVTEKN